MPLQDAAMTQHSGLCSSRAHCGVKKLTVDCVAYLQLQRDMQQLLPRFSNTLCSPAEVRLEKGITNASNPTCVGIQEGR